MIMVTMTNERRDKKIMVTRCIWTIFHLHSYATEFTTDPDRAELMSKQGHRVTGRIWKGIR